MRNLDIAMQRRAWNAPAPVPHAVLHRTDEDPGFRWAWPAEHHRHAGIFAAMRRYYGL
jgi:hypothetical protein